LDEAEGLAEGSVALGKFDDHWKEGRCMQPHEVFQWTGAEVLRQIV
jgi:hypothetical protein